MSLNIRIFGPMNDSKKELHNLFTRLGYPVYVDFVNGNLQWVEKNKECSFFYYFNGSAGNVSLWPCTEDEPDLQITPPYDLFVDGGDGLMDWLDGLLGGDVVIYEPAPPPVSQLLELPVFEADPGEKEYKLENMLVNDCMFYQVIKPNCDRPYTTVVREFGKKGHRRFFTNLFVCNSWGVAKQDIQFLKKAWEWFEMEGEFDLDAMMKEATEACKYPTMETEPEVWRNDLKAVLEIFNKRIGFYFVGYSFFFFLAGSSCSKSTFVTLIRSPALPSARLYQAPISACTSTF